MWRAFFLALGVYTFLLGLQCLGVQEFVLNLREPVRRTEVTQTAIPVPTQGPNRRIATPPWAPWSLMSTGTIVCLYSFSIPVRLKTTS